MADMPVEDSLAGPNLAEIRELVKERLSAEMPRKIEDVDGYVSFNCRLIAIAANGRAGELQADVQAAFPGQLAEDLRATFDDVMRYFHDVVDMLLRWAKREAAEAVRRGVPHSAVNDILNQKLARDFIRWGTP